MIQRHFAEILLTFLINICVYIVSIKGVILLKQFSFLLFPPNVREQISNFSSRPVNQRIVDIMTLLFSGIMVSSRALYHAFLLSNMYINVHVRFWLCFSPVWSR